LFIFLTSRQKFNEDDVDKPNTDFDDDSDVVCNAIVTHVVKSKSPEGIVTTADGNLAHTVQVNGGSRGNHEHRIRN
jgi:hypothetical protein